jgi:6-phosphogluconolactonase
MVKRRNFLSALAIALTAGFVFSCNKIGDFFDFDHNPDNTGYVYTMSNDAGTNSVLIYKQEANGRLKYKATVNSGGAGNGMGLGSQGALALDRKHRQLYAVNPGGNSVSAFKVSQNGMLTLSQTIAVEGSTPVSVTVHHSLLYVVNGGGNICGFKIAQDGSLAKIDGSSRPLSMPTAGPAEILFKPDGSLLVVTEKATNKIAIFKVNSGGVAQPGEFHDAQAETPFGFVFAGRDRLIITNAFGGAPDASTITSFSVGGHGSLNLISNIPDHEAAACWVVLTKDQDYAFVTNTGSNSISSLKVKNNGSLELVDSVAVSTGGAPTDIILSGNGKYAYNVNSMSHSIGQYKILNNGRLQSLGDLPGLPVAAAGIVAW